MPQLLLIGPCDPGDVVSVTRIEQLEGWADCAWKPKVVFHSDYLDALERLGLSVDEVVECCRREGLQLEFVF